jgi:hypothetical protein
MHSFCHTSVKGNERQNCAKPHQCLVVVTRLHRSLLGLTSTHCYVLSWQLAVGSIIMGMVKLTIDFYVMRVMLPAGAKASRVKLDLSHTGHLT